MRKTIFILLVLMALTTLPCHSKTTPAVSVIEGTILHSIQSAWEIAESENSGDTQATALAVIERTKTLVDAAIAADSSGDGNISVYTLPSKWNGIRLRCIGITDAATPTHQIYLGTLGGETDCELSHAGQLAWTIGTQTSIYDQITFTSGGTYEPLAGDFVTGNTSGETAVVVSISALSSGAWADGDAAGTITYKSATGAFTSGETVRITRANIFLSANALTHAASDLVAFELADTLTATAKAWGSSWTATSPADNSNAEAEIDIKGADYMVILTSNCPVDAKLLIKGY